mmetsp:Transcript_42300/g.136376  ORF Transcript_42300/g.136376 Transcript_42300/m.136376 type:complete len:291 (-) Transcript_42300:54-926(-)
MARGSCWRVYRSRPSSSPRPPSPSSSPRAGLLWRGRFGGRELRHARPPADATHAARALALASRRRAPAGAGILGRGLLGPLPLRLVLRPRATPLGPALDCAARRLHAALLRGRLPDPARFGQRTACGERLVRRLHPHPRHGCRDHVFAAGRGHRVGAPPPHEQLAAQVRRDLLARAGPQCTAAQHLVQAPPRGGGGRAGLVGPRRRLPPHGRRAVGADRPPPGRLAVCPAGPTPARDRGGALARRDESSPAPERRRPPPAPRRHTCTFGFASSARGRSGRRVVARGVGVI